jgi:hypothetical protein
MSEGTYLGEDHRTIGIPVMGKIERLAAVQEIDEASRPTEDAAMYAAHAELVNKVVELERKVDGIINDLKRLYPPHEHSCLCPR